MNELPWFRFYSKFITDPEIEELAFDDQRHYVFVLCMKNMGLLDKEFLTNEKKERAIGRRLGLYGEAFTFAKERLIDSGLIDESWQPRSWDELQFKSDSAAERMRRHRAKNKTKPSPLRNSYGVEQNRTDTESDTEERGKPSKRAPKEYQPTPELLDKLCAEFGLGTPDLLVELAAMKDHEFRDAKKDWDAVFRNWVRRTQKWGVTAPAKKLTYAQQLKVDIDVANR